MPSGYNVHWTALGEGNVAAGQLKILAVGGKDRLRLMPDIPTLDEAGVQGCELTGWFGMVALAKTPESMLGRLIHARR